MLDDLENNFKQINTDFIVNEKFDYLSEQMRPQGVSSMVTIQEGCDKFCSFCVVPYTRGPEYSRSIKSIGDEVKLLSQKGAKEIVFLGQNVNAYNDKSSNNDAKLLDLIRAISEFDSVKRIRYTTSHPINMDEELIQEHKNNM